MKQAAFTIREMVPEDITGAMKLSTAEGWNQTENDWKFLTGNPGNRCLVAECSNTIIGTTTAMNYSNKLTWIGMVLVNKEFRGQGVSASLLTAVLKKLSSVNSVKLDATPAGQLVYKKFGFREEFEILRMANLAFGDLPVDKDENMLPEPIGSNDVKNISDFDQRIFGVNRSSLIKYLLSEYPQKAWMLKRNNLITGIALRRAGNKYHHIGPVFGNSINDVKILLAAASKELKHQPVVVDVLVDKKDVIGWLNRNGFTVQRKFMRMYKGENLFPGNVGSQYLICGPEFG